MEKSGDFNEDDLELGKIKRVKPAKKKKKNKIKESRSLIGQAKYELKNKFMPGNSHN